MPASSATGNGRTCRQRSSCPATGSIYGSAISCRPTARLALGDYLLLDESALTGESLPVEKKAGDTVYSGAIVKQGEMDAQVTMTGTGHVLREDHPAPCGKTAAEPFPGRGPEDRGLPHPPRGRAREHRLYRRPHASRVPAGYSPVRAHPCGRLRSRPRCRHVLTVTLAVGAVALAKKKRS